MKDKEKKVVKLKTKTKNPDIEGDGSGTFKVTGETFTRIKSIVDLHNDAVAQMEKLRKEFSERSEVARKELWEALYKEMPELKKRGLTFNTTYEKLGFYLIEERVVGGMGINLAEILGK